MPNMTPNTINKHTQLIEWGDLSKTRFYTVVFHFYMRSPSRLVLLDLNIKTFPELNMDKKIDGECLVLAYTIFEREFQTISL